MKKKAKIIALYLPQFHPTPNNDIWWGKGFTEWTNLCKARPLFKGHYQPRVPADLGFYDLRMPEARKMQADMAREYGVDAFCYYHYWFDDNHQELERPFNEVLNSGEPDFPFMLCWANESWHTKFWRHDGTSEKKLLVEQKYGNENSNILHFEHLLSAFKDPRYLRKDDKPLFMIYRPLEFPNVKEFIDLWQKLAIKNGLNGIYFIGQTEYVDSVGDEILSLGFDAVNAVRLYEEFSYNKKKNLLTKIYLKTLKLTKVKFFPKNRRIDYRKCYSKFVGEKEKEEFIVPTLIPNFDHTPRSGMGGHLLDNSTPEYFGMHAKQVFETLKMKTDNEPLVFIKSWNEWGEGNYMEPDLRYGKGYLKELKKAKEEFES